MAAANLRDVQVVAASQSLLLNIGKSVGFEVRKVVGVPEDCVVELQVSELAGLADHVLLGLEPFFVVVVQHFLRALEVLHVHQQAHHSRARPALAVVAVECHNVLLVPCVIIQLPRRCLYAN